MPEPLTFEAIKTAQEAKVLSWEQIKAEQEIVAWKPPTPEEEAIEEDWTGFAAGAVTTATTMAVGLPAGLVAGGTSIFAEAGSIYLGKVAGQVHPTLETPVQLGSVFLSAFTLENWLINKTFKALPHVPKFWSKEFTLASEKGMLSKQFVDDSADIIHKMDMGDKAATEKMLNIFRQGAYEKQMIKTGKQLKKIEKVEKIFEPVEKVLTRFTKKKILDERDYQHLARIAKEDAVIEYNTLFNKTKINVINKTANDKWQNHKMKDIFDAIIEDGGISPIYKFASSELKDVLIKRHPELKATKAVTAKLEKIADDFGYIDVDDMVFDVFQTPNQTMFRQMTSAELAPEFNRIYRDEILLRITEKEADYLFKLHKVKEVGEEKLIKLRAKEALYRVSNTLSAKQVIGEVEALKKATVQLLKITQKPALDKAKILRLRSIYNQKLADYQAAVKVKKELGLINQRLKYTTGIAGEYGEQLDNLLAPLFNKEFKRLDRHMFAFLKDKYKDEVSIGADILIKKYNGLLKNFPFSKRNFMELTYNQAKDLDEFVKAFRFVAKNEQYIYHKAEKMLITTLARDIHKEAATTIPKIKFLQPRLTTTQLEHLAESSKGHLFKAHRSAADVTSGVLATFKRIEAICYQLDGFKTFGRAWKYIFNKTIMAEVAKEQLGRQVFGHYEKIFAVHRATTKIKPTKYWSATSGNLLGKPMSKETAFFMALNSKNTDNMTAMLDGLGVSKKEVMNFINGALNKADWKLIDDILDSLDEVFPIIAKIYKQKTGLTLQKVKKGRYFPILADRKYADIHEKIDDLFLDSTSELFRAEVKKTFTELRVGGVKAVRLNFNGLTQHLADVVHYTTHWAPLNEIQRLTKNVDFKRAVETTMGTEIYNQFDPWLKNLARPSVTKIDKWMGKARRNVTFASLAFVPKIAVKQSLSFITAMPEMGYINAMKSLKEFMLDPFTITRAIKEASPEMAYRSKTWNRDFVEMMAEFSPTGTKNRIQRIGYTMIHKVDGITSAVVWNGAYKKGLKDFNGDANLAVNFANKVVRETQPASAPKDIPKIMRSGEGLRAITMFYSYWSVFHGQVATTVSKGLSGHMTPLQVAGTLAWLCIAPAVTQQLAKAAWNSLTGREQEEEHIKEMAKGIALNAVGGLPVVRDLSTDLLRGYEYQISPAMMGLKEAVDVGEAIEKIFDEDQELNQYDYESAMKLISYFKLAPSKAMIVAVTGSLRLYEGETTDWTELIERAPYEK